ncbi:MAG: hypothetical protein BWZ10_00770 [candidate division BRC1 bacterium ADurb.BinA364]|nr:MAG: hypothetical protein BWZ10_00770 [candidate division BRC1 bacterium ADurb.BinA364]
MLVAFDRAGHDLLFQAFHRRSVHGKRFEIEANPHAAAPRHLGQMSGQAEAGDVGAGVGAELDHQFGGVAIQRGHRLAGCAQALRRGAANLRGKGNHPRAQRLCQHEAIAWLGRVAGDNPSRIDQARDGESELDLFVVDAVAAEQRAAGFLQLERSAAQHSLQHGGIEAVDRIADDGQRRQRPTAHGVDVGERIGRRDLAEEKRIVHAGSEDIDGLHERGALVEPVHTRVVPGRSAEQHIGILHGWQRFDDAQQIGLADLGGAAGLAHSARQCFWLCSARRTLARALANAQPLEHVAGARLFRIADAMAQAHRAPHDGFAPFQVDFHSIEILVMAHS